MNLEEINKILENLVGDVKIYTGNSHYGKPGADYHYMMCHTTQKDAFSLTEHLNDIDHLIKIAWSLKKKELIHIKKICIDLINKQVFVDKTYPITIVGIEATKDGTVVKTSKGRTFSADDLWMEV